MKKNSPSFVCASCDYTTVKWLGCCPSCNQWDTFDERTPMPTIPQSVPATVTQMHNIDTIPAQSHTRLESGIEEWDRVVGGGIVPGSLLILTGDPGIGKSTLLLQLSAQLAQHNKVFYFSTEESLQQVKIRADRLGCTAPNLFFSDNASLDSIITTAQEQKPAMIIIDSVQNCYLPSTKSTPGSVGQLRESTFRLMRLAKEHTITVLMSGHITKEGNIAGPKTLEHMVDAVFYLQGDDRWQTRMLRSVKNRFGTINEIGFFEMQSNGLVEVVNINAHLINEITHAPGSALVSYIEGSRPLLLELQALTIESKLTIPQRVVSGFDHKQVVLLAAILQKYLQVRLSTHDIFFKVSGGFKITGSAADLGIALALLSSYFQQPLPEKSIIVGEISLTGHIKPVTQINTYIREAEKFGIKRILVAKNQNLASTNCKVQRFDNVYELLTLFTDM